VGVVHPRWVFMDVFLFYFSFIFLQVCLWMCFCSISLLFFYRYLLLFVYLHMRMSSDPRSRSIRSGASRLPYYCTPLVCVLTAIGLLAVWRNNINQKQFTYCSRPLVQPRWECNRCKVPKVLKVSP